MVQIKLNENDENINSNSRFEGNDQNILTNSSKFGRNDENVSLCQ